jgi:hypothetical protein
LLVALSLAACRLPGSVPPTVKIGLSAPFEGRFRDEGYEALYAVRLAVRERNAAGGVGERYLVELVALNDLNEPQEAVIQAHKMAIDPGVLGVIGGWSSDTASAAGPVYERLDLPFLSPPPETITRGHGGASAPLPTDPAFSDRYQELSGGAAPGPIAFWAYAAASDLLNAVDTVVRDQGRPTRSNVRSALGTACCASSAW